MLRTALLSLLALVASANLAHAEGFTASDHEKVIARLSGYFKKLQYAGVDADGKFCRVDIARIGFPANPSQIFVTGYDRYPMPQPGNTILRQAGFFQIGTHPAWFIIKEATFSDEQVKITILVPNATSPVIYGIGDWTGTLILRPSRSGSGLGSVEMHESLYDPSSNMSSTRRFFCGEPGQN